MLACPNLRSRRVTPAELPGFGVCLNSGEIFWFYYLLLLLLFSSVLVPGDYFVIPSVLTLPEFYIAFRVVLLDPSDE